VHVRQTTLTNLDQSASFLKPVSDGNEWFRDKYPATSLPTSRVFADLYFISDDPSSQNRDFHIDSRMVVSCAVSNDRLCQPGTLVLPPDAYEYVNRLSSISIMEVPPNRIPRFKLDGNLALQAYNNRIIQSSDEQCLRFNA
jgi:hypothetical protein